MKYGSLILEKKEYVYLKRILNISGYAEDFETQKSLQKLSKKLKKAQIVNEHEMPVDIIRFNSKVTVASDRGWEKIIQIVIPADEDLKQNKVSVLTSIGAALIGYSQTDIVNWIFPNGMQQLKIKKVQQDQIQNKIKETI